MLRSRWRDSPCGRDWTRSGEAAVGRLRLVLCCGAWHLPKHVAPGLIEVPLEVITVAALVIANYWDPRHAREDFLVGIHVAIAPRITTVTDVVGVVAHL
jgi:hypothetical protein